MREIVVDLKRAQRPGSAVQPFPHVGDMHLSLKTAPIPDHPRPLACVGRRGGVSLGLRSAIPDSFPREAIGVSAGSISDLFIGEACLRAQRLRDCLTAAISFRRDRFRWRRTLLDSRPGVA